MNIVNKFLLVCLQLIIISLMSLRVEGREGGSPSGGHVNRLLDSIDSIPLGPSTTRAYRLYSRCSSKDVLVQDKISATANSTDKKGLLQLQTVMAGGVRTRIYGMDADRYVCFNHKGRLVTKPKKKARGAKCEFVEEVTGGYSQFRSAKNEDWFIGFNQKGKPLLATAYLLQATTRAKNCFDFLKLGNSPSYFNHHHHHHHGQLSSLNHQGKQYIFPDKARRRANHKKFIN